MYKTNKLHKEIQQLDLFCDDHYVSLVTFLGEQLQSINQVLRQNPDFFAV